MRSGFVTVITLTNFEFLFLLFVFAIFVCTMRFLGNVLFLCNMGRFGKFSSNSSSASVSKEAGESAQEKSLLLTVHLCSSKLNDLIQKGILDSSKHKMFFNNNKINGITVSSCQVSQALQRQSATL